jgi:hypothetical protein
MRAATLLRFSAALLLFGCSATVLTIPPGAHRRDASFAVTARERAAGESMTWEKGAVTRDGDVIAVTVDGLEVGTAGFDGLVVVGEVYDLSDAAAVAGTYQRIVADVPGSADPGAALLGNENGVLLLLRTADGEDPIGPAPEGLIVQVVE